MRDCKKLRCLLPRGIGARMARILLSLLLLFLYPSWLPAWELPEGEIGLPHLRVLVLTENRLLSPWYEASLSSFRQTMRQRYGCAVSLQWDPVNMSRYLDPAEHGSVVKEFAANHTEPPPDLVISFDSAALFALEQKKRFFPDNPVVALTLEEPLMAGFRLPHDFTTVPHDLAPRQTVETALDLFPGLKRLVVVNGSSPIEQAHRKTIEQALAPLSARLQIDWTDHLPYEEIHQYVARLPKGSAVLFVRLLQDSTGRWFTPQEVVGTLSRATDAPVFVLWGTLLGTGALGGVLMDPTLEGEIAADQANLLLSNRPVPPRVLPAVPIFDRQVMRRFGLEPRELLAGSLLRNNPPNIWEEHRRLILATAAVIGVLALAIVALIINISRRRRAEERLRQHAEALRSSEEKFRAIFEQAAIGMGRVGFSEARWINVNDAFCRMLGYSSEELQATPWPQITHPEDIDIDLIPFRQMAAGELESYSVEKRFIHKYGHPLWARLTLSLVRDSEGRPDYEIAIIEDISERKRAADALRESEERFRSVMENMSEGLMLFDPDGNLIYQNPASLRLHGFAEGEERMEHEELPETWEAWDESGRRVDFHDWPVSRVLRHERFQNQVLHVLRVKTGLEFDGSYNGSPIYDEGKLVFGFIIIRDISEQRRAEREIRQLNAELEHRVEERTAELSAVNRELEAFTYTVSHDLRAPLRHVTSFVELLGAKVSDHLDEQGKRYIQIIGDAGRRMGMLIDDLLTFSRIGRADLNRRRVDLENLVEEVRRELAPQSKERNIEWTIGPLPAVQADPLLLRTVLTNYLGNALKYTRDSDPARIEVGCQTNSGEVIVYVKDNGAGFDMRYADKLFGVFQRLHREEEFQGTGIGLASVRRIIQRHGGRTWAKGEVGRGATFYFSLAHQDEKPPAGA